MAGTGSPLVLHVLEAIEGGTARHLIDIVRHVPGVRHEVVIPPRRVGGLTDEEAAEAMRGTGAAVHQLPMTRAPLTRHNAATVLQLRRLIARRRPGVVHGHSSVGGALARAAAWTAPTARLYTPNGLATGRAAIAVERLLGRRTDRLVAVSESEARQVLELKLVAPERVVVIPNGIELGPPQGPAPDLRMELGVPPEAPLVTSVGRLVAQKAPECFVRACAVIGRLRTDAHFLLVGGGPLQSLVDREIARSALGGRFHHVVAVPGVGWLLGQSDVFVLPSRFEGGPYTPLEAMRAGTPVVLSDVVGNCDIVEHGVTGLLVPPDDPDATAAAVLDLLARPDRGRDLAAAAAARLPERFDVRVAGRALGELYSRVAPRS